MKRLDGKIAWISGATSGIGEAAARLFAMEGAKVAIVGRRKDRAEAICAEIQSSGGESIVSICDVSIPMQVENSIKAVAEKWGGIDILVNNSGMVDVRMLHEYSIDDWERVMNVNVRSIYLSFLNAYPFLKRKKRSYIVNVGSISSIVGQAKTPVYTTSKHAVQGLTKSIALDYADIGLRCNCVCPGITDTPMLREHMGTGAAGDAALRKRLKRVPMGVSLSPQDVAKSILYFSCDDSAGVTGTSLVVDCGYLTAAEWESPDYTSFMD